MQEQKLCGNKIRPLVLRFYWCEDIFVLYLTLFFFYIFQRASNEYFDMVIFMTFFILVSIVCFILLLKVGN